MHKLWLRFFLTFWVAFALVAVASTIAAGWVAEQRREAEMARQDQLAEAARAVFDTGGLPALRDWLYVNSQREMPDNLLFIVDTAGHDLLERRLPDYVRARIGRARFPLAPGDSAAARAVTRDSRLAALVGPDGLRYDLYFSSRRRSMSPFGPLQELSYIAGGLALLVIAVLSFLMARHFSRPVRALRDATLELAAGNLDVRVAGRMRARRDELGALAVDFDAMAARLRTLLEARQTLLRDISHELRSPLARLQVALGLARRPGAGLDQQLDRIEEEAQRLDDLIGEILSLTRLDDPAGRLEPEDIELQELLDALCEDARMEGEPRRIDVQLQCPPDLRLRGDRELLGRAFENVLRNAVRFTPDGGPVLVKAEHRPGGVQVTIEDRGPGVPEASLARIFEPFYRVADARDRDSGGHGIGLAIAARVVRLHHGTIQAANLPGGGLAVTIDLPGQAQGSAGRGVGG